MFGFCNSHLSGIISVKNKFNEKTYKVLKMTGIGCLRCIYNHLTYLYFDIVHRNLLYLSSLQTKRAKERKIIKKNYSVGSPLICLKHVSEENIFVLVLWKMLL